MPARYQCGSGTARARIASTARPYARKRFVASRMRSGVTTSARSIAATWTFGLPGGSHRATPRISPSVVHTWASAISKPVRKSQGRSAARRCAFGSTHVHAGSSWKAPARRMLASRSRSAGSRTMSTEATLIGCPIAPRPAPLWLRRLDLEDLELRGAARSRDLDDVALLVAHDRLADG